MSHWVKLVVYGSALLMLPVWYPIAFVYYLVQGAQREFRHLDVQPTKPRHLFRVK